jgi:hypothetical protein
MKKIILRLFFCFVCFNSTSIYSMDEESDYSNPPSTCASKGEPSKNSEILSKNSERLQGWAKTLHNNISAENKDNTSATYLNEFISRCNTLNNNFNFIEACQLVVLVEKKRETQIFLDDNPVFENTENAKTLLQYVRYGLSENIKMFHLFRDLNFYSHLFKIIEKCLVYWNQNSVDENQKINKINLYLDKPETKQLIVENNTVFSIFTNPENGLLRDQTFYNRIF